MKILSGLLAVLIALLLGALLLEHRKATDLEAALGDLGKEREAMNARIRKLDTRVAELQKRPIAAASAEAPAARPAPPAAIPLPVPEASPGVTIEAPAGWHRNGKNAESYVVGVDSNQTWGGMPSAYVKSLVPTVDGFGGMMQTAAADNYVGKRVKLSGWMKTEDANDGGGHLWLRVDGQERGVSLQFDNMDNRAVKGTSDWQEASVVLDVPQGASALAYGFFVSGGGKMWVSGTRIEEVGPDVKSTNMLPPRKPLPKGPVNLGFGSGQAK